MRLNNVINVIKCRLLNWKLQQNTLQAQANFCAWEWDRMNEKWEKPPYALLLLWITKRKCSSQHYSILIADSTEVKSYTQKSAIIFSHQAAAHFFFSCPFEGRYVPSSSPENSNSKRHPSSPLSHGWWSAVLSPMEQPSEHADIGVRHIIGERNTRRLHIGGRRKISEST